METRLNNAFYVATRMLDLPELDKYMYYMVTRLNNAFYVATWA